MMKEGSLDNTRHCESVVNESERLMVAVIRRLSPDYHLHVHFSDLANADISLTEGLKTKQDAIGFFAYELNHLNDDGDQSILFMLRNSYNARTSSILLAFPKADEQYCSDIASNGTESAAQAFNKSRIYLNSIAQQDKHGAYKIIPTKYLVGYYDILHRKWTGNDSFISEPA